MGGEVLGRNKVQLISACDKAALCLLCILMADCCVTGAGRVLMFGPISFRMTVLALLLLMSVPLMIHRRNRLWHSVSVWGIVLFWVWLLIETVRGIQNGAKPGHIITDLKGFSYFALLPAAICVLDSRDRVHRLMKVMMYASGVLALITVAHLIWYVWDRPVYLALYFWGLKNGFSIFAQVTETIPRLFFKSTNYFMCGCAFATYFQMISEKLRLRYVVITALCLFALLISYTRATYLAVFVAACLLIAGSLVCVPKTLYGRLCKQIISSVVVFCVILGAFTVSAKADYFGYALQRTMGSVEIPKISAPLTEEILPVEEMPSVEEVPSVEELSLAEETLPVGKMLSVEEVPPVEEVEREISAEEFQKDTMKSDQLRARLREDLMGKIAKSPLIGHGMGIGQEVCGEPGSSCEYFYLDLLTRTGVVGLLLYFSPLLHIVTWVVLRGRKDREQWFVLVPWICVLFGFIVFSYFNPYMNAALGVLFYCCVAGVFHGLKDHMARSSQKMVLQE